ncbi:MAG TPA: nucleotidyltransferase family protein [Bacteroidota bacterium]
MNNPIQMVLQQNKQILEERFHVKEIGIFGSVARGNATAESDVDILVEFSGPVGWEFFELKDFLEKILLRRVDLVTSKALKNAYREKILHEVVYS